MKIIQCYCNKEVEVEFPEEIDISKNPAIIDSIMDGTFMSVQCPYCGKLLKLEEQVHLFDSSGTLDLLMVPELQRNALLSGQLTVQAKRVAVGYPELVEKMSIHLAGLDEGAVEILKLPGINRDNRSEVSIYFSELEKDTLIFHIHGLDPEKIGVTKISRELYDKTLLFIASTDDPLYQEVLTPPYISAKKMYREETI